MLPAFLTCSPAAQALGPYLVDLLTTQPSSQAQGLDSFSFSALVTTLPRLMGHLDIASNFISQLDDMLLTLPHLARVSVHERRLQLVFVNAKSASKAIVSIPLSPFLFLNGPSSSSGDNGEDKVELDLQQLLNSNSNALKSEIQSTIDAFTPHALYQTVDGIQSLGIMVHESLS